MKYAVEALLLMEIRRSYSRGVRLVDFAVS